MCSLRKLSVSVLFIILSSSACGGDPFRLAAGASEAGSGYACLTKTGFWTSFHNQALLSFEKNISAGLSCDTRFGLPELSTSSIALIVPQGRASIGALVSHMGYNGYSRTLSGLACGLRLGKQVTGGIQVDLFTGRSSSDYVLNLSATIEAGIIVAASENISVGVHLFNPLPDPLRSRQLPQSLRAGAGMILSRSLYGGVEFCISTGCEPEARVGFEWEVSKNLFLAGGYCSCLNRFSLGTGFRAGRVRFNVAFTSHQQLGISSTASAVFDIASKQ